jgi:hypothetical protein
MPEASEVQGETVKPMTNKECQHCAEEIKPSARVCRYCSRVQHGFSRAFNYIRPAEILSVILSVSLLGFSIAQFRRADLQLTQAGEANIKAQEALGKANEALSKAASALQKTIETEARVLEARREVFEIAQAVIEVARNTSTCWSIRRVR